MNTIKGLGAVIAASAAALSLAAIGAPAHASQVSVSVADLDFHKPADLATFNARVQAAARQFCSTEATGTRVASQGPCIRAVVQEAFDSLDAAHKHDIVLAGDRMVLKGLASR